jgi:broad specificity phosphatase PhoE
LTEVILIRHAESEGAGRYLGRRSDPPLNAKGRAQAEALAKRLMGEPLAAIYSSPLRRALDTAEAIAAFHSLEVNLVADLAELDFGAWDGLSYSEIQSRDPERLARWLADPVTIHPPSGETLAHMSQRVVAATQAIVAAHLEGAVAIVSHGGPIRALVCHALGLPLEAHRRIRQDLAAITRLDWYETRVVLSLLNDTCHLWGM